ncbi:hypothetical protein [Kitasatospora sp. NPDC091207]|uniref:hypothetical protein n=1 Tax=Kitasatospora sp. NPDC091207 TaxID=3364083 RepID=UPI0037F594C4
MVRRSPVRPESDGPKAFGRSPGRRTVGRARPVIVLVLAALAGSVVVTGCASADEAKPEEMTFSYSGSTLDVVSLHHVPTDLVATDRQDIKVTRWFKADVVGTQKSDWSLEGDTLTLEASCSGFANCDARFRVEVPSSVAVLRDGRATDLKGTVL